MQENYYRRWRVLVATLALTALASVAVAATGTVAPAPKHQWFDNNGDACSSCLLFSYTAGTSTKESTFSDSALSSANSNPATLNAAGRLTGGLFLNPGTSYKFILAPANDTDPPASPLWTIDNVQSVPAANVDVDVSATAGEALSAGDLVYLSQGDGGRTSGRWYKADADLDYASVTANSMGFAVAAISSGSTGTARVTGRMTGLSGLSVGSVYYVSATAGATTTSAPTLARKVGVADSTTSMIMSHWVPHVDATTSIAGLINTSAQAFAGVKSFTDHGQFEPGTSTGTYAPWSGVLESNTTVVGNITTGVDDLMSYSVPANVLSANGKALRITAKGAIASSVNLKKFSAYYGGTKVFDNSTIVNNGDSVARFWMIEIYIVRTGASTQLTWARFFAAGSNSSTAVAPSSLSDGWHGAVLTTSIDTTAASIVKIACEATATNECTQESMIVETMK